MARVYADLVRKGRKALDAVPKKLRADVENILNGATPVPWHRRNHPAPWSDRVSFPSWAKKNPLHFRYQMVDRIAFCRS